MTITLTCQCGAVLTYHGDAKEAETLNGFAERHRNLGHRVMRTNLSDGDGRVTVAHNDRRQVAHNDPA